jgi:hypothetical protein
MKKWIVLSLCIFFSLITLAHSAGQKEYVSPNGKYRAYVIALQKVRHGNSESKVIIKTRDGKTLCTKSYGSKDGEHGFNVEKAAWTPDSNFFVYSMSSSGGHQPWHFPIDFISVADSAVRSLDDYVGSITDPNFELRAPDTVKAVGTKRDRDEETTLEARLSELVARKK